MDMNNVNIEEIVKQVLSGMTGNAPAAAILHRQHQLESRRQPE